MTDRKLGRGTATALAGCGILLLLFAAAGNAYWQALFLNLGTGVLLFVALEHALYGPAERLTALITSTLQAQAQADERAAEMWTWAGTLSSQERRALPRRLQAISPLPVAELEDLERQLQTIDQMDTTERMKGQSYYMLADRYGPEHVRQVRTVPRTP